MSSSTNKLLEFRDTFLNEAVSYAASEGIFNEEAFIKLSIDKILNDGQTYEPERVQHNQVQTKIHAYAFGEADGVLSIFTSNFMHLKGDWLIPQSRADVMKIVERGKRFVEKSVTKSFTDKMEPSSEDRSAAVFIRNKIDLKAISSISLYFLTDGLLSDRIKKFSVDNIFEIPTFVKPYDIKDFQELSSSETGDEDFTINFDEICGGLNALSTDLTGLQSFLTVMPATVLDKIYFEHGQSLLQSNVRNWLNFKNPKNAAMRKTMLEDPDKFFAYNNGLTVTATDIDFNVLDSGVKINKLQNLNIVNGGQTTCSIFFAKREKWKYADQIDLSKVFIPMKLTVINASKESDEESYLAATEFRSNIAKYANFQTAVIGADLQANHLFHVRLSNISRNLLAPPDKDGMKTYWFYERMKGQYSILNKLADSPKHFTQKYPSTQKITKEFMATGENTWRTLPHIVSGGAGNNLGKFYEKVIKEYDQNPDRFREDFFRKVVAKRIIFKELLKIISASEWFPKGTFARPYIANYTISLILYKLRSQNEDLNLQIIWDKQTITDSLRQQLDHSGAIVCSKFMDASFTDNNQLREFARKASTWTKFQSVDPDLKFLEKKDCLNEYEMIDDEKEVVETGKLGREVEDIKSLMSKSKKEWDALLEFQYQQGYILGQAEINLPIMAANMLITGKIPTEAQFKYLANILAKAKELEFEFIESMEPN